jgi:hypothetical protein
LLLPQAAAEKPGRSELRPFCGAVDDLNKPARRRPDEAAAGADRFIVKVLLYCLGWPRFCRRGSSAEPDPEIAACDFRMELEIIVGGNAAASNRNETAFNIKER